MKITLLTIGKTSFPYLQTGIDLYQKRLERYTTFDVRVLPDVRGAKKMPAEELKKREGEVLLKFIDDGDLLFLLDERGKTFGSVDFAHWLERHLRSGKRKIVFAVGGAYGFSDAVYARANGKLSLSKMTFSHQMIRVFFVEQLYRAFTILRGEPYHNEG